MPHQSFHPAARPAYILQDFTLIKVEKHSVLLKNINEISVLFNLKINFFSNFSETIILVLDKQK